MVLSEKQEAFTATYDKGDGEQIIRVPHKIFNSIPSAFQKHLKHTKCLDCNVEFNFSEESQS